MASQVVTFLPFLKWPYQDCIFVLRWSAWSMVIILSCQSVKQFTFAVIETQQVNQHTGIGKAESETVEQSESESESESDSDSESESKSDCSTVSLSTFPTPVC